MMGITFSLVKQTFPFLQLILDTILEDLQPRMVQMTAIDPTHQL